MHDQTERDEHRENGSVSRTLLERLRRRDPEAWQRLCDVYGPLVYKWCRRAGVGAEDAADVFQEVFLGVAGGIEVVEV